MELQSLHGVAETGEPGVFIADVTITDLSGDTYRCDFISRETDTFGLGPTVRQEINTWIAEGNTPMPFIPPTSEEIRAAMPPLSARQLRLGLIANGISLVSVQAAVDAMSDPAEREKAQVEWEYATTFERTHALISQIGSALSLTPEQIDTMWEAAAAR